MAEAATFLPAAIGAGTQLAGGLIKGGAIDSATQAQLRAGQDINKLLLPAYQQGESYLDPQRQFNTLALSQLANQYGLGTGTASQDPYAQQRPDFVSAMAPYERAQAVLGGNAAGIMDQFGGPLGANGMPDWYNALSGGFKASPGYAFTRDEALRSGLQASGPNVMGGGRMREAERIASGIAAQQYPQFMENATKSVLGGAQVGLMAGGQSSTDFARAAAALSGGMENNLGAYDKYFERLRQLAGIGANAPNQAAGLTTDFTKLAAGNISSMGATQATGDIQQGLNTANMIGGIGNSLTGVNGPFNPLNPNSLIGGSSSFGSPDSSRNVGSYTDFGGGSDTGINSPYGGLGYIGNPSAQTNINAYI